MKSRQSRNSCFKGFQALGLHLTSGTVLLVLLFFLHLFLFKTYLTLSLTFPAGGHCIHEGVYTRCEKLAKELLGDCSYEL